MNLFMVFSSLHIVIAALWAWRFATLDYLACPINVSLPINVETLQRR